MSAEVPIHVVVQVMAQMLCTQTPMAWVSTLLGGIGFRLYRVPYDVELGQMIEESVNRFWKQVESGEPPAEAPSMEVIKRIQRVPESQVEIARDLVDEYVAAKEAKKQADAIAAEAEKRLKWALGTAELGYTPDGLATVTYYEQTRKGYEVKPTSYRVMRIKHHQ